MAKTLTKTLFILALGFLFFYPEAHAAAKAPKLIIFFSPGCHNCIKVKNKIIPKIEENFKGKIEIEYRDISDMANYKFLLSLQETYKAKDRKVTVPLFFIAGRFLDAKGDIANNLHAFILDSLGEPQAGQEATSIDLMKHFKSFTPFVIIGAGLIDGINPCAFTVIVFFISFLALQGYIKRELVIIGLSFIFTVFLTYLLIGVGLFNFFYRFKGFWLISKTLNYSIGAFSILMGVFALYDFLRFKRTGNTEGLFLQLPKAVKNQIHAVIGMHYRDTQKGQHPVKKNILKLVLSALVTGFLVSLLESVCTGQTYLPTITFVLKATSLKLQALAYLLLYNLMFIIPLLIIFLLALFGVTSGEFSKFLKSRLLTIKILMALLFFGLGVFLIWRA